MNILLHTCCSPCLSYPLTVLKQQGINFTPYFFNPNIHPYLEYKKRLDSFKSYVEQEKLFCICEQHYGLISFLRNTVNREKDRCVVCYHLRLEQTAILAKERGFDSFTSTLLYSKYQKHDLIKNLGEKISFETGVPFYYRDFRTGWSIGKDLSIKLGLYRQPYCGCIYSEQERYDKNYKTSLEEKL